MTKWSNDDIRNKLTQNEDGSFSPKIPAQKFVVRESRSTPVAQAGSLKYELLVDPMGAPRMTRSDQWKTDVNHPDPKKRQRVVVNKYFKFKSLIRSEADRVGFTMPNSGAHLIFHIPLPETWKNEKKADHVGKPCQSKPDIDNICKAVFDALVEEDKVIWEVKITKVWSYKGKIEVILT